MGFFKFLKNTHFSTRVKTRTQFYLLPWKKELSIEIADLADALFQELEAHVLKEGEGWGEDADYNVLAIFAIGSGLKKLPLTGGEFNNEWGTPVKVESFDRVMMLCALGRALQMVGAHIDSKFTKDNKSRLNRNVTLFYSEMEKLQAPHTGIKNDLMLLQVRMFN